jgi:hypothetical protein
MFDHDIKVKTMLPKFAKLAFTFLFTEEVIICMTSEIDDTPTVLQLCNSEWGDHNAYNRTFDSNGNVVSFKTINRQVESHS